MSPRPRHSLLLLIALVLAILGLVAAATESPPEITCDHCIATGYAYSCMVPMASNECFYLAGDAHCTGTQCSCCRLEYTKGCVRCETADMVHLPEDDEELLDEL